MSKRGAIPQGTKFARASLLLLAVLNIGAKGPAPELFIDPGHGGGEQGVRSSAFNEADLALEVGKALQAALKERGVSAVLSREDAGSNPPLSARVTAANASRARAFISLHLNHSPSPYVHGPRLFVPKEAQAAAGAEGAPPRWEKAAGLKAGEARRLGAELAKALAQGSQKPGVQNLNLAAFKGLKLPAVVVELGFASHAESQERFKDAGYRRELAARLARGWMAYSGGQP